MSKLIAKIIGTSGGVGFIPGAPGTYGAAIGALIYYLLYIYCSLDINIGLLSLISMFTALGTWACIVVKDEWGKDPSKIVIDETVGLWITYLFMPFSIQNIIIGFILFRFFDILKPFGIRYIDTKIKHSFSVMLDDILAGVYALIVMQLLQYIV